MTEDLPKRRRGRPRKPLAPAPGAKRQTKNGKSNRERFVDEFMLDRNATQAAIRAGYSVKTAGAAGHRLLKNAQICTEINKRSAEQSIRLQITADRVMQEYEAVALLDPLDLFNPDGSFKPLDEIPEAARRAMSSVEIVELFDGRGENRKHIGYVKKFKFVDKRGALDSIAKILGMLKDGITQTNNQAVTLIITPVSAGRAESTNGQIINAHTINHSDEPEGGNNRPSVGVCTVDL